MSTRSKMNKGSDASVEPLHPTVAVSDSFMAACALYSAYTCPLPISRLGFLCTGVACSFGVLRFGFFPETFRPFNECFAALTGRVGIPLIGLGFLNLTEHRALLPVNDMQVLFALMLMYCFTLPLSHKAGELITTLLGAASMGVIAQFGSAAGNQQAIAGVVLFIGGGLVIGADRNRCLFGVRRENLFHYTLGTALFLICQASIASVQGTCSDLAAVVTSGTAWTGILIRHLYP